MCFDPSFEALTPSIHPSLHFYMHPSLHLSTSLHPPLHLYIFCRDIGSHPHEPKGARFEGADEGLAFVIHAVRLDTSPSLRRMSVTRSEIKGAKTQQEHATIPWKFDFQVAQKRDAPHVMLAILR